MHFLTAVLDIYVYLCTYVDEDQQSFEDSLKEIQESEIVRYTENVASILKTMVLIFSVPEEPTK